MSDPPHRLRTMGSVDLTGPKEHVAARVLGQPKRLAVLAYLAARPPGERVGRDRVIVTFWPELPTDRARAGLRNALHFLRRALGGDTILSRGHSLEIDPERLYCDASELLADRHNDDVEGRSPSPAADRERLLDLYGGEFLDGLHVSEAPDFERWVDRVRAALRRRATDLAWELSEAAERRGEWITAAGFARRAAELAVDVEGASQRLIRLLDRAGDRAAALAAFERLQQRLEAAYGVAPSPETVALAAEVRGRSEPADVPGREDSGRARHRYRSLAVLPFEEAEGSGDFGAGLNDDLLAALARLRDVRVVSRTSVQRFAEDRPRSMSDVREVLGVDVVVEGSVRVAADRVRIAVRLVDAAHDAHLWEETYDVRSDQVFDVQSDIALRIARALDVELSPRDHQRLRQAPTESAEAYRLYVEGRVLWARRSPTTAGRAAEIFERALAADPELVRAWAGLADAHLLLANLVPGAMAQSTGRARKAIQRALDLDSDSGEANATLGLLRLFIDWDFEAGERHLRRAVEASPGYATAHQWYGQWLTAAGDVESGLAEVETALALDPLSPAVHEGKALALYHAGRVEEALEQFRRTWELDPNYGRAPFGLALCHAALGDRERAAHSMVSAWGLNAGGGTREEVVEILERGERGPDGQLRGMRELVAARAAQAPTLRMVETVLSGLLGDHDEALASVEAARAEGSLGFLIIYAPVLDPLQDDGRFTTLMEEAGLRLPRWR